MDSTTQIDWAEFQKQLDEMTKQKDYQRENYGPYYPYYPAPCPGCGRCPVCGRGGNHYPYYPWITWEAR